MEHGKLECCNNNIISQKAEQIGLRESRVKTYTVFERFFSGFNSLYIFISNIVKTTDDEIRTLVSSNILNSNEFLHLSSLHLIFFIFCPADTCGSTYHLLQVLHLSFYLFNH